MGCNGDGLGLKIDIAVGAHHFIPQWFEGAELAGELQVGHLIDRAPQVFLHPFQLSSDPDFFDGVFLMELFQLNLTCGTFSAPSSDSK